MKQIIATLTDDQAHHLESLAQQMGLTAAELVARSIAMYLERAEAAVAFDLVGSGMWADRAEMQDPIQWVARLREQRWRV